MTSKTLSPSKLGESLRERLIREGTIVPSKSLNLLKQKIDTELAVLKTIKLIKGVLDSYTERCISILKGFCALEVPNLHVNLCAFLALKKIDRLKKKLLNDRKSEFSLFNVYRCGFFFAFKENKKNTP